MGDMGDMPANNTWKIYLDSDDIAKTVEDGGARGRPDRLLPRWRWQTSVPRHCSSTRPAPTSAPGRQAPFPGFTVLNEHGSPSWFELQTRDYAAAVSFYRSVFHWDTDTVSDSDEFRYATDAWSRRRGRVGGNHGRQRSSPREYPRTGRCTGKSTTPT